MDILIYNRSKDIKSYNSIQTFIVHTFVLCWSLKFNINEMSLCDRYLSQWFFQWNCHFDRNNKTVIILFILQFLWCYISKCELLLDWCEHAQLSSAQCILFPSVSHWEICQLHQFELLVILNSTSPLSCLQWSMWQWCTAVWYSLWPGVGLLEFRGHN